MKYLIFDAGPLISLAMNGLLDVLEKLKKEFNGEFIITTQVKKEVVDRPARIKQYALESFRMKDLLDKGVLKLASKFVANNQIEKETMRILKITNSVFQTRGENIELVQEAEASCLAFSNLCNAENVIVIDERTTRMLTESPQNLQKLMEGKLHTKIKPNKKNLEQLKNFKFIRSTELVYIAYKKNLIPLKDGKELLDALLYGLKYKGTAISSGEIEVMKSLAKG